ncbi:unnamed protein product [Closterium sp. NIES-64]|nr:unnamed protein product [Closterium sp. NIES-64]
MVEIEEIEDTRVENSYLQSTAAQNTTSAARIATGDAGTVGSRSGSGSDGAKVAGEPSDLGGDGRLSSAAGFEASQNGAAGSGSGAGGVKAGEKEEEGRGESAGGGGAEREGVKARGKDSAGEGEAERGGEDLPGEQGGFKDALSDLAGTGGEAAAGEEAEEVFEDALTEEELRKVSGSEVNRERAEEVLEDALTEEELRKVSEGRGGGRGNGERGRGKGNQERAEEEFEDALTEEGQRKKALAEAEVIKARGNEEYKRGDYNAALESYSNALAAAPGAEHAEAKESRAIYHANRAMCHLQLKDYDACVTESTAAIDLKPDYVKAIMRRAQAWEKLDKLEEALGDYKKVLEVDKTNTQARSSARRLEPIVEERREKLKEEMLVEEQAAQELGITYQLYSHPPVLTVEEQAAQVTGATGETLESTQKSFDLLLPAWLAGAGFHLPTLFASAGAYSGGAGCTVEEQAAQVTGATGEFTKNLLLKDKKGRLILISALTKTKIDLKLLSQRLGLGKGGLRMAPDENLAAVLQVPAGCVTPLALFNDSAKDVVLLLDQGFASQQHLLFHPLSNDATVALTRETFESFLGTVGRSEPAYVDLEANVVVGKDQPPDLASLLPAASTAAAAGDAASAPTSAATSTTSGASASSNTGGNGNAPKAGAAAAGKGKSASQKKTAAAVPKGPPGDDVATCMTRILDMLTEHMKVG